MAVDVNQLRDLKLINRIRSGDAAAKEELIRKYFPLVKHIVKRHYAPFLEFEDLMQEGVIGLLGAVSEYRPDQFDMKFSSFSYMCVIRKVYNAIKQSNGNKHRALNQAVSLHSFVNADESRTMMDLIADETGKDDPLERVETACINERIDRILRKHLSILEYSVIVLVIEGYSYAEIERLIGVKPKVIDNARTRVKAKLKRIVDQYGSLHSPHIPLNVRHRRDLYRKLPVSMPAVRQTFAEGRVTS